METIVLRKAQSKELKRFGLYVTIPVSGIMRFSKLASENLGIEDGSRISFFQDENLEGQWFFSISEEGEFGVREQWNGQGTSRFMTFGSTKLKQEIWDSLGIEDEKLNLYIKEEIRSNENGVFYKLYFKS